MAQHDYDIANQTSSGLRTDLNNVLAAIVSTNSATTAPLTTFANMLWYDTATNILKMRNEADTAWIALGTLDQTNGLFIPEFNGLTFVQGDVIYHDGTDFARLALGTANQQLRVNAGATAPEWATVTAVDAFNAVGSYCMCFDNTTSTHTRAAGSSVAGSNLTPASYNQNGYNYNASGSPLKSSGSLSGTWRVMGYVSVNSGDSDRSLCLYHRIS